MAALVLDVSDDSGFLALVDPEAYQSFVAEQWAFDQLFNHFKQRMHDKSLLIWGTGSENLWRVVISFERTNEEGFREASGPIYVTGDRLLMVNYEELTMAAQYATFSLSEDHIIPVERGRYRCRVVQITNPDVASAYERGERKEVDFLVELIKDDQLLDSWIEVPWHH